MTINSVSSVLWDWNGTLLNDVNHCICCMNILLKQRKLDRLFKKRYLEVFTFPVKTYYTHLGFTFETEPFEIPAEEFIQHYNKGLKKVPLFNDALPLLEFFHKKGMHQYIVSAMQHNALHESVASHNILHYFSRVQGIEDNLAHGKTAIAMALMNDVKIIPKQTLLIGDTLHDVEVAREIGVKNILIARGHQHHTRLRANGNKVYLSLKELLEAMQ